VLLEDREVNEPGPDRAVVFQNHSLLPWLTVYDNVRLARGQGLFPHKPRAERDAGTLHNLDLVQMTHAKDKRPAEISGGMKQRVGIARGARDGAEGSAARRAVRRARRAHARASAGFGDGDRTRSSATPC
jgi:ABC-type nitrate/sulfonate/bicarbonate transport system ATPase subunit